MKGLLPSLALRVAANRECRAVGYGREPRAGQLCTTQGQARNFTTHPARLAGLRVPVV